MYNKNGMKKLKGLTLMELLVALAILIFLLMIVVPQFTRIHQRAKVATAKVQIEEIGTALGLVRADTGKYPEKLTYLENNSAPGSTYVNWGGPYISTVPKDPWGNAYFYDTWEGEGTIFSSPIIPRHTPPTTEVDTFSASPGDYTLIAYAKKVSSALVMIDGKEVLNPYDFNAETQVINRRLTLSGNDHHIEVRIKSDPGATLQIDIIKPIPEVEVSDTCLPPSSYKEGGYNWAYLYPGEDKKEGFILGSYGADRLPGGEGFKKDIIYGRY